MAKNRSRRLRKKMHIDEFQELGFSVAWRFPEGTSEEQIDKTVDDFINEVIEPNKLAFDGSGYLDTGAYGGLVLLEENQIPARTVLRALDIVKRDYEKKLTRDDEAEK